MSLQLIPFLQIINLVLTLFNTLRLILTPFTHHRRYLFPISSSQISPIKLRKLLSIRFQQTNNSCITPFFTILPILCSYSSYSTATARNRFWSLVKRVRRRCVSDLVSILTFLASGVIIERISVIVGVVVGDGFGMDRSGGEMVVSVVVVMVVMWCEGLVKMVRVVAIVTED
jgi:hypothetical protein